MNTRPAEPILFVPTAFELARLRDVAPGLLSDVSWQAVQVVGFGPVSAAACASAALQAPGVSTGSSGARDAWLIGVAGRYDAGPAVGSAARFGHVGIDGVGAGEGAAHVLPSAMGFPQLASSGGSSGGDVFEHIRLASGRGAGSSSLPSLLTVCAASDGAQMRHERQRRHPAAVAEDMEAFGVALATRLANVPLTVVRGISNEAGDRDTSNWRIDDALESAAQLVLALRSESNA